MLIDQIQTGDRLEITRKKDRNLGRQYVSQVENVRKDKTVVAHVPISYGQLVPLNPNDVYSLVFLSEKGMLRFDGAVVETFDRDGFSLMRLRLLTGGERVQQREFFRFTCLLPLKFVPVDEGNGLSVFEGIIKDIGGGGIRFVGNVEIAVGSKIKCYITLHDEQVICLGTILMQEHFPKSNYKYQYRLQFVGILKTEQEQIIQYIFNEQRKLIQKTRG